MKLPRLPNRGPVLEAKYTAKQMRDYARKAVELFQSGLEPTVYSYVLKIEGKEVEEVFLRSNFDPRHMPFGRHGVDHDGQVIKQPFTPLPKEKAK